MTTPGDKTRVFQDMHQSGCWMIPNPWDVGSARMLESLGFTALATTSSGFAWTLGRPDNHVTLDEALAHFAAIAASVNVPVNGDFEGAFAVTPEHVAENMERAATTGIAGLSIEDSTGDEHSPLFGHDLAVERVAAARAGVDAAGTGVVLTARTEGFIVGRPDLDETLRRLVAFAAAGADCLYAPGIKTPEEIRAVVEAVAPRAVNVLVGSDFTTRDSLAALGVRRISVGGALARAAWGGFLDAATEIATQGTFGGLARAMPFAHLEAAFKRYV